MNLFARLRIPGQAFGAVCDALVSSDETRKARDLQQMYRDMDALNEVEAELDGLPGGPYLSWPEPAANDPQSSPAVPPAGVSPSEVSAPSPTEAPSGGQPPTAEVIAEVLGKHLTKGCRCSCEAALWGYDSWREHVAPLIAERIEKAAPPAKVTQDDLVQAAALLRDHAEGYSLNPEHGWPERVYALAERLAASSEFVGYRAGEGQ